MSEYDTGVRAFSRKRFPNNLKIPVGKICSNCGNEDCAEKHGDVGEDYCSQWIPIKEKQKDEEIKIAKLPQKICENCGYHGNHQEKDRGKCYAPYYDGLNIWPYDFNSICNENLWIPVPEKSQNNSYSPQKEIETLKIENKSNRETIVSMREYILSQKQEINMLQQKLDQHAD